jgi:glycosyltransferase involved in cell wall biosynthesis
MLSKISGIHAETEKLCNDLKCRNGLGNVDIFPNFRLFDYDENRFCAVENDKFKTSDVLKLVFVSRVDQTKGLDTLLHVADILRNKYQVPFVSIDFYGQKKDEYFDKYLQNIPFYSYMGELRPEQVIATLGKYDGLIFPTHYDGEGCPGILIEALAAGIPVIASDWKYNGEFVITGENGFLCDTYNSEEYVAVMETLFYDNELRKNMSMRSYKMSRLFSQSNAKTLIKNILN